ncbi:MAG: hypothetical protein Q7U71_04990 [bacterium]|nr:hypothetical protein [bacterium]
MQQLDILYGIQGLVFEIRILEKTQKVFFFFYKEPNAEGRDIFNAQ